MSTVRSEQPNRNIEDQLKQIDQSIYLTLQKKHATRASVLIDEPAKLTMLRDLEKQHVRLLFQRVRAVINIEHTLEETLKSAQEYLLSNINSVSHSFALEIAYQMHDTLLFLADPNMTKAQKQERQQLFDEFLALVRSLSEKDGIGLRLFANLVAGIGIGVFTSGLAYAGLTIYNIYDFVKIHSESRDRTRNGRTRDATMNTLSTQLVIMLTARNATDDISTTNRLQSESEALDIAIRETLKAKRKLTANNYSSELEKRHVGLILTRTRNKLKEQGGADTVIQLLSSVEQLLLQNIDNMQRTLSLLAATQLHDTFLLLHDPNVTDLEKLMAVDRFIACWAAVKELTFSPTNGFTANTFASKERFHSSVQSFFRAALPAAILPTVVSDALVSDDERKLENKMRAVLSSMESMIATIRTNYTLHDIASLEEMQRQRAVTASTSTNVATSTGTSDETSIATSTSTADDAPRRLSGRLSGS